jgi:hypothetical protein
MRKLTIMAAVAAALAAGSAAYAFTPSPHPETGMDVTLKASGGCGPGWHLTANGLCRRDLVPNVYRPYAYDPLFDYGPHCFWASTAYGMRRICTW